PSVVDDDVIWGENVQVPQGAAALVGMGDEVEIEGQPGFKLVKTTHQALRIVCARGGRSIAACEQRARKIDLGAIDRKQPMAPPRVAASLLCIGGEDPLV